jgi:hypothetical protein
MSRITKLSLANYSSGYKTKGGVFPENNILQALSGMIRTKPGTGQTNL